MTLNELKQLKQPLRYFSSSEDNLYRISNVLYGRYNSRICDYLIRLNPRYDWENLPPGSEIFYYPFDLLNRLTEVV